ncbi:hypothetical protein [Photobacterium damselae]|uniref:hypothetical protein n=1 Tax=Photobacterium damselae TaxID=38293 RepID=UPI001F186B05|nr:hypothetical protein [Photobacterium damselae]UKA04715.1 hypothetical protein IHC89_20970 [Photobacterium damselae subsp. damselae]
MKRIVCSLVVCGVVIVGGVLKNSDENEHFKRPIYSVNLVGKPTLNRVITLQKPILTPQTIGENVKESVLKIETIDLGDPDKYIESIKPLFTNDYFPQVKANLEVRSEYYVKNLVRVLDFVVTKQPLYIGSKVGSVKSWTFYLEGVYGLKGFGTMNSTGKRRIFVTVEESKSADGNPIGARISDYRYV